MGRKELSRLPKGGKEGKGGRVFVIHMHVVCYGWMDKK